MIVPSLLGVSPSIPAKATAVLVSGFFSAITVLALILMQIFGARIFEIIMEKSRTGPVIFFFAALLAGITGILTGAFVEDEGPALLIGLISGFLVWTALGEVAEQLGWVSTMARSAVALFLIAFALWLSGFLFRGIPVAVTAGLGYPVCIWGLHLVRVRVLAKWGPSSLPSTILALVNAALAGGGLALGMSYATPLSGIIGGVVFAMATWSTLEILWEHGTARRPWRR
ncbi:hypothetical protein GX411_01300 [Candidatus Fermentibacteria bacterium]|nr:hypothetical protein [Candidatus Fermentibacteria bacterium]